jgi:hypothetical protein
MKHFTLGKVEGLPKEPLRIKETVGADQNPHGSGMTIKWMLHINEEHRKIKERNQ